MSNVKFNRPSLCAILTKLAAFSKKIVFKIILYTMAFVVCSMISLIVVYHYYNNFFRREVENHYKNALQNLSVGIDGVFTEIYQSAGLLPRDEGFKAIITSDLPQIPDNISQLTSSIKTLSAFRSSKSYIGNVFLIDDADNLIIGGDGTVSTYVFFNISSRFLEYPEGFWLNLPKQNFQTLAPSVVIDTAQSRHLVIPVVLRHFGDFTSRKTFVMTLDANYFDALLADQQFTAGSILAIYGGDGQLYAENVKQDGAYHSWMGQIAAASPVGNQIDTLLAKFQNKPMLVMLLRTQVLENNFIYSACIPISDLYQKTDYIKNLTVYVTALLLLMSVTISWVMGRYIYNPIRKMLQALQRTSDNENAGLRNEMDDMGDRLGRIISDFDNVRHELTAITPLAVEQLLYRLLNEQEWTNLDLYDLVRDKCGFRHSAFVAAILQLKWTDTFYKHFNKTEQQRIVNGILQLMRETLESGGYHHYLLPAEQNKAAVIINIPEGCDEASIQGCFQEFINLFSTDMLYIQWLIGIGRRKDELRQITDSYHEAATALTALTYYSPNRIRIYDNTLSAAIQPGSTLRGMKYLLPYEDETKLNNYLTGGMEANARQLINSIIENNAGEGITDENRKELYNHIYLIGKRSAMRRGTDPDTLLPPGQRYFLDNLNQASLDEISEAVFAFLQNLFDQTREAVKKTDITAVKKYIEDRYAQDIYAESVADDFGISASHLSKMMKSTTGMALKQYISYIRIEHAKEILQGTDKTIEEIARQTGFNSRNTFIRMFERLEGITPTEYRRLNM